MASSDSIVTVTRHESGVTLDFQLAPDPREKIRRDAWRLFEVGIFLLVGVLITFAVCEFAEWTVYKGFLPAFFGLGVILLIASATVSWHAWQRDSSADDDVRQLSVAGNMLIRTSRDQRKQIWYANEIATITLGMFTGKTNESTVLFADLKNGQQVVLIGQSLHVVAGKDVCAQLEWISAELRRALLNEPLASAPELADAIQAAELHPRETRITG